MNGRLVSWLATGVGLALAVAGIAWSMAQSSSGNQPWSSVLSDNVIFAKSLPLIIGFGILTGLGRGLVYRRGTDRRSDGAIRRFSRGTVLNHWINAVGFLLALTSGTSQYLKGLLDTDPPVPLFMIYRVHFIGASLMVFSASVFVTYRLMVPDRPLVPKAGQWIRHLRGLAHELPRPLGRLLAGFLGLDMKRQPPPVEQFTYYEKVVSFPIWTALLTLILITGFVKAMRYIYPIPGGVLWWASVLHVAAMVLLAIKFLDHLRYVLAPSRWPLLASMFTTWCSEQYVRVRHPAWYEALQKEREAVSEGAAPHRGATAEASAVGSSIPGGGR